MCNVCVKIIIIMKMCDMWSNDWLMKMIIIIIIIIWPNMSIILIIIIWKK